MPSSETNWTTVSGKPKAKAAPSSTKSTAAPVLPKAEVKTIKLSDSAFSSMKDRIADENDENDAGVVKTQKPPSAAEKNPPVKASKPTKSTATALPLKQALQNLSADKLKQLYKTSKDNTSLWVDKVCYWFIEQVKDVSSGSNDPTFSKGTDPEYPVSVLSSSVREYLKEIFDTPSTLKAITLCRNGLLNPNADNNSIVGYQVLLKYLLRHLGERPNSSFLEEVDEMSASFKRYPSDKALRLLWAYSQLPSEHSGLALEIWFRLMFPLIENRTYNQLVVENLSQLTTQNAKTKKFLPTNELFPVGSYVKLLDFVDRPNPAVTREMRASLTKSAATLSELFANNTKNINQNSTEYFKVLFPLLQSDKQRSTKTQTAIDRMILACCTDKSMIKTWLALHQKNPRSSLNLLSLLQTNETSTSGLSSSKDLRTIIQQLRTVSNDESNNVDHNEFLRVYANNDTVVVNKRQTHSKSKTGSLLKLIVLLAVSYTIYSNWLWLTVATDYLLEDHLKHPTAIVLKERLAEGFQETKKLSAVALKRGEELVRSTMIQIEPYAIKLGQHLQKQWNLLLKYIEGPVYDKSVEIAEQIQRLSVVVFHRSVHVLNNLFELASHRTAKLTRSTEVYIKQVYAILYHKVTHFDVSSLRERFDQLRMRLIKSV